MCRIVLSRAIWRWSAVLRLHYPVIIRAISQLVFAETEVPVSFPKVFFVVSSLDRNRSALSKGSIISKDPCL
jgi:hypothetical protein